MGLFGAVLREDAVYRHGVETGLGFTARGAYEKVAGTARAITSGTAGMKVAGKHIPYTPMIGIAVMDDQLRVACSAGAVTAWVNRAYKLKNGKPIVNTVWKQERSRFRDLGLNDEDIDGIFKILADPKVVQVRDTVLGKKALKLNFDKWGDQALADKFQIALQDHVARVIQLNKTGNFSPWMNTVSGRAATQFRQFVINATYKQLGYGLKRADATTANMFMGSVFFAYLGYVVSTHSNAAGKTGLEREIYLKEAFDDKQMLGFNVPKPLLAAVMRSSPSGIIPAVTDTIATLADDEREPFFDPYMRTTGLGVGLIQGMPAYGIAQSLSTLGIEGGRAALHGLSGGELGGQFTRSDYRKSVNRLLPFKNMIGVNRLYDSMNRGIESALPRTEQ